MSLLITTGTGPVLVSETETEYLWTPQESTNTAPPPSHLLNTQIVVLDSVKSGTRVPSKDLYKQLLQPLFSSWDLSHRYIATTSAKSVEQYGHSLGSEKTLLIVLSGDTTISELINSVADSVDVTILNVPLGTGNAFAHSIGLSNVVSAVSALTSGKIHPLRTYQAVFEPGSQVVLPDGPSFAATTLNFFVVGSWGLHACLVADSDSPELRKLGNERFKIAAQQVLEKNPVFHGTFVVDGKQIEAHASLGYFVVAAVPLFEKTFEISPQSDPAEHSLHLVYFHHTTPESVVEIMTKAYQQGEHVKDPRVGYLKGSEIELEVHESDPALRRICVDGTIVQIAGSKVVFRPRIFDGLHYLSVN
ncbi:hypothetical protein OGAPHI_005844 [Ogataea philodendri]|uniref:DAGKc domain-containing protein n=1 Tax=Ogataea philodendri TaxID=1378263 RepID=A0A9P8P0G2_9ASCO|nr:uncharacterized protein OGAPHI_005844 [Ogataea philodendri]KAH3662592.1 hypothetical protein OGAPHI_005844 [Ogataea philodendri]